MSDEKKELLVPEKAASITKEIEVSKEGIVLRTVEDAVNFAKWNVESGFLPDHIQNAKQAFAIMARGAEMGLKPHASWRWIYMTKAGKLAMESKGMLAVCQSSPHFAGYREWIENESGDPSEWKAVAVARRKGLDDQLATFSYRDAQTAGLVQQKRNRKGDLYDGPYQLYLKDMLKARARARALELQFSDVLGGIPAREIAEEIENRDSNGQLRATKPATVVHDPLLDEVSGGPQKTPEEQEVIDAQVDEILPEAEADTPKAPTSNECQGCGVVYHIDRKACPECGVPAGEEPAPPKEDNEPQEMEAKHRREQMKLLDEDD